MSATGKKTEAVTIKGTAGGLLMRLRDDTPAAWPDLLVELADRLKAGDRFFRGGRAQVELGNRLLESSQLEDLRVALANHQIELETIISGAQATRTLAKQAGLTFKFPGSQTTRPPRPVIEGGKSEAGRSPQPFDSAEALFLRRTLRSGQRVQHHADVIVLGDINPGAEIVAGGSVIVWGTLRGQIEAGQVQNGAVICALSLRPNLLRIGSVAAVGSQQALHEPESGPEMASVQDGAIIVESWLPKRAHR